MKISSPGLKLIALLVLVSLWLPACMPVAPTPLPTPTLTFTPTPLPTQTPIPLPTLTPTPSDVDLSGEILLAIRSVVEKPFTANVEVQTSIRQSVVGSNKIVRETTINETVSDEITRARVTTGWAVRLNRTITKPESGAQGDLLWVNDHLFARGKAARGKESELVFPGGWVPYYGSTTEIFWPGFSTLHFSAERSTLNGSPWVTLVGQDFSVLERSFFSQVQKSTFEPFTLEDGQEGKRITLWVQSPETADGMKGANWFSPALLAAVSTPQGAQVEHHFVLDSTGKLVSWERELAVDIQDASVSSAAGDDSGSRVSLSGTQTVKITFSQEAQLTLQEPTAAEMESSPAFFSQVADLSAPFTDLDEFTQTLSAALDGGGLDAFWQNIKLLRQMPLIFNDQVVFLYRGQADSVEWAGDWSELGQTLGTRQGNTDLWVGLLKLPLDARMEYKIVLDGRDRILDPLNPIEEEGGLGSSSAFAMPGYQNPTFTETREDVARGELSENLTIKSGNLGYPVNFRVYTPSGYAKLKNLPVIYVDDGQDFLSFGKMINVLDNLIADQKIRPVIAVFIDPRDTVSAENLRDKQFLDNPQYDDFITKELVPYIEFKYRAERKRDSRALIGASYGGFHAAHFGLEKYAKFGLIGMLSPSLWVNEGVLLDEFRKSDKLDLKIFLSTGTMNDNTTVSREMKSILEEKGYDFLYVESNQGHSYANWRDKLDDLLIFFFGVEPK